MNASVSHYAEAFGQHDLKFGVQFNSGGEALTALLGGHVDASIGNPLEFMSNLKSGNIRAIGVFRQTRFEGLPDVPTLKELGITAPDFQMWRGIAVPKGAPDGAVKYWEGVMKKVAASAEFNQYLKENVASPAPIAGGSIVGGRRRPSHVKSLCTRALASVSSG